MVNLRRFNKYDAMSYLNIANDERSYFPFGFCQSLKEAYFVIDFYISTEVDAYAIIKDNILIGAIYAETISKGYVDVSYFIGKDFQRKGYVTDALKIFQKILVEKSQVQKIRFSIDKNNLASIKTALKFGAKFHMSGQRLDYYEKVII